MFFVPLLVSEDERDWYLLQHTDGKNTFLFYCLLQVYKVSIYTRVYVYLCVLVHSLPPRHTPLGWGFLCDPEALNARKSVISLNFSGYVRTSISHSLPNPANNTMTLRVRAVKIGSYNCKQDKLRPCVGLA